MAKLKFDAQGKFVGIGDKEFDKEFDKGFQKEDRRRSFEKEDRPKSITFMNHGGKKHNCQICGRPIWHRGNCFECNIRNKKASQLALNDILYTKKDNKLETSSFQKIDYTQKFDTSQDTEYWSLYKDKNKLSPLQFSNKKTQEDVVKEVVGLIRQGKKAIFLHGVCGTGKSAIALNIARILGKTAIVVPIKNLQSQYKEDYMSKMFLLKPNGEKLRISLITGRDNHDSVFKPGVSCADPFLPDTIQIIEKNFKQLKEFYEQNPLISHKNLVDMKQLRRVSIAPTNPYWSPIIPARYNMNLPDATKKPYKGLRGTDFIFYHRKKGCSYYDQYQEYLEADVLIFNAVKYKIEVALDRKPETEVDIIDEADEFLDSFSNQSELNLTRLKHALNNFYSEDANTMSITDKIIELIKLEEKNKKAIGINENSIFQIKDTNIHQILALLLKDRIMESEISLEEDSSYLSKALEIAKNFEEFFSDTYLTYRIYEENLYANLVTTNLSKRLQEVLDKNKAFVFMSGTLHSKTVLEKVFGITDYVVVEVETIPPGIVEIHQTGKEFDCRHIHFSSGAAKREDYLIALSNCIKKAKHPKLIHINAFADLPTKEETDQFFLKSLMPREKLIKMQKSDKTGRLISEFKQGAFDSLYSTKCFRGIDFPGDTCCSVIFTKYPNPNSQDAFWKILKKTHPQYYWDFYKDKAKREFLQRLYRALRSPNDHVFVLSPDSRVLDAVREFQLKNA